MKILLVIDEMWNDQMHPNNVLSNWFTGMDVELAAICCNPGLPKNHCCYNYFQVTDAMMVKSIFGRRAGRVFTVSEEQMYDDKQLTSAEKVPERFYSFMKSITNNFIYVIRDCIWLMGRYDKKALKDFVQAFSPDIVYCPRMFTPKMCRLENIVRKYTDAPFVAFVADDEVSLKQYNLSPVYWMRRLLNFHRFKKHVKIYKHYFTFSKDQSIEYERTYKVPSSTLYKCGSFEHEIIKERVNSPIKLVYAGSLYCKRWESLVALGEALNKINQSEIRMTLDVYTKTVLSKQAMGALEKCPFVNLKGAVAPEKLVDIYRDADIALHVESFDKQFKLVTRWSFSTKIIDLLGSSCAILAICWDQHTGYKYLKENNAAFCVSDYAQLEETLKYIADNPELIREYAHKAWQCGENNHSRTNIQNQIITEFTKIIKS